MVFVACVAWLRVYIQTKPHYADQRVEQHSAEYRDRTKRLQDYSIKGFANSRPAMYVYIYGGRTSCFRVQGLFRLFAHLAPCFDA